MRQRFESRFIGTFAAAGFVLGAAGLAPAAEPDSSPRAHSAPAAATAPAPSTTTQPARHASTRGVALSADELFSAVSPAVALIEVRDAQNRSIGQGSGFFISADGLLVTNFHVIGGATSATVRCSGGATTVAVEGIASADEASDLVLLKVKGESFPFLTVDDGAAPPPVGTRVFAIGNPYGLTNTLSEGLVSGLRTKTDSRPALIQTSAPISPGSSGGPLVCADSTVIGVTSSGLMDGQNLNFAVPADLVRKLIASRDANKELRSLASASAAATASGFISGRDMGRLMEICIAVDRGRIPEATAMLKVLRGKQETPV